MERKHTLITIIILLVIALIITSVYLLMSRQEIASLKSADGKLAGDVNSLTICDNINTADEEAACVARLTQISALLTTYGEKLKDIKIPTQ